MNNKKDLQNNTNKSSSYEVGYGKPPKSSQFKKGVSGNPSGRKKKVIPKSIKEEALELELTHKITITDENNKKANVYLFEVLVKQIIKDALNKDGRSRKLLLESLMKIDLLYTKKYLAEKDNESKLNTKQRELLKKSVLAKLDQMLTNETTSNEIP